MAEVQRRNIVGGALDVERLQAVLRLQLALGEGELGPDQHDVEIFGNVHVVSGLGFPCVPGLAQRFHFVHGVVGGPQLLLFLLYFLVAADVFFGEGVLLAAVDMSSRPFRPRRL